MSRNVINRIKVEKAEKNLSCEWLTLRLGKFEALISRWFTIGVQITLNTLPSIPELLGVPECGYDIQHT